MPASLFPDMPVPRANDRPTGRARRRGAWRSAWGVLLVALGVSGCVAPAGPGTGVSGDPGAGAIDLGMNVDGGDSVRPANSKVSARPGVTARPGVAASKAEAVDDGNGGSTRERVAPVRVAAAWEDGLERDAPPSEDGSSGLKADVGRAGDASRIGDSGGGSAEGDRVDEAGRFESLAFALDGVDRREGANPQDGAEAIGGGESSVAGEAISEGAGRGSRAAPLPVEHYVSLAVASHPKIRAARRRVAAEQNRVPQVRSLPDPTFGNTFWPAPENALQTAAGRVGNQMGLTQSVPWPEKLRTRAAVVNREVEVARAELERVEREIAEAVRLAYFELWYATRAIKVVSSSEGVVDDLTRVADARYRSGGSQQDVLRAQLEADRLTDQLTVLRRQREVAQADLAALIRRPLTEAPRAQDELGLETIPGGVPERLDEIVQAAERCNPELRGLAWEIERDRQRQRLAGLERYPDLQFGASWWLVRDGADSISPVANGRDNFSFTVGTTLPIWRAKIDGGIREAAHRAAGTRERYDAERDALYGRLRRLLAEAVSLEEQREIYRSRILPRLEDTLRIAVADYRGERADFFTVIETYRELLNVQTQLARIDADLAGTIAKLERAIGCPLDGGERDERS